jgi:hypothetical protein
MIKVEIKERITVNKKKTYYFFDYKDGKRCRITSGAFHLYNTDG